MKENNCYCAAIRNGAQQLTSFYDEQLRPSGLSIAQYSLLSHLASIERANITQWADYVGLERSTMVRNARLLEAKGLLERADGIRKTFTVSPLGRQALAKALPLWLDIQNKVENILGQDDAAALLRIQSKLHVLKK